jgi:hypothetical protein
LVRSQEKKNKGKIHQISSFDFFFFQYVAKNTQGWLKIVPSYLVNSQIWLNFLGWITICAFYIFIWMIAILAQICLKIYKKERGCIKGTLELDATLETQLQI